MWLHETKREENPVDNFSGINYWSPTYDSQMKLKFEWFALGFWPTKIDWLHQIIICCEMINWLISFENHSKNYQYIIIQKFEIEFYRIIKPLVE